MSDDDARRRMEERERFRRQEAHRKQRGRENPQKGERFHRGMAQMRGETRENGWVREHREYTTEGNRRIDQARVYSEHGERAFTEYKSGRVDDTKETRRQIAIDRHLLETERYYSGAWVTVQGKHIPQEIRALLQQMEQDFKGRFQHIEVSQEMAVQAIDLGKSLELVRQLELPGVGEQALQQKAQQREQQAKAAELEKKVRERAEKFRKMLRFREAAARGRSDAPQHAEQDRQAREQVKRTLEARRTQETERARVERAAAERVAQEFPAPDQYPQQEATDASEQAAPEAADAASVKRSAAEARAAVEKNVRLRSKLLTRHETRRSRSWTRRGACRRWNDSCGWGRRITRKQR
ncbi:hypothetical protein IU450_24790 [Nocardia abscessus]|uniref:hypothetical protein n=1 Tax=Nocardia abscessus TaxID=120957 RepID=UPI001893F896|nr:hypothetical protein [Nocardia abscessus]MBF6339085.1 hypothetical protein [Nocardia abscessus]